MREEKERPKERELLNEDEGWAAWAMCSDRQVTNSTKVERRGNREGRLEPGNGTELPAFPF